MNLNTFTNYGEPGYVGYKKFGLNDLSVVKKVILMPPGTQIATQSAAATLATWVALMKAPMATRVHPYPLAIECKVENGTTIMQKAALSGNMPVREDPTTLVLTYNVDAILATLMKKNNNKMWDVVLVDAFGNILGWTPDGTKFQGFTTTSVYFGQMGYSDGSKVRENLLTISLADPNEWNQNPALIQADGIDWFPLSLEGTTAVKLTVSDIQSAGFTVSVNAVGKDLTDPYGAYTGLVLADFKPTKTGASVSWAGGASLADNGDGTYAIVTSTTNDIDSLGLAIPSAISVAAYNIECPTPVACVHAKPV